MKSSAITAIPFLMACFGTSAVRAQTSTEIRPPPISLFEAVKLTEDYSTERKLQHHPQFLSSVRYVVPGAGASERPFGDQPYWEVTYDLIHNMPASGQHFYVSIDKKVKVLPGE